jgi:hypothetical protein
MDRCEDVGLVGSSVGSRPLISACPVCLQMVRRSALVLAVVGGASAFVAPALPLRATPTRCTRCVCLHNLSTPVRAQGGVRTRTMHTRECLAGSLCATHARTHMSTAQAVDTCTRTYPRRCTSR